MRNPASAIRSAEHVYPHALHMVLEMATEDSTAFSAVTAVLADGRAKPDADQADCHHGNN